MKKFLISLCVCLVVYCVSWSDNGFYKFTSCAEHVTVTEEGVFLRNGSTPVAFGVKNIFDKFIPMKLVYTIDAYNSIEDAEKALEDSKK